MKTILQEKEYQAFIIERLRDNGYEVRDAKQFDRFHAVDCELVFRFLEETQPENAEQTAEPPFEDSTVPEADNANTVPPESAPDAASPAESLPQ